VANRKLDPRRGSVVAAQLKDLGVRGILIISADKGYITELACQMPECLCPEELGGRGYFQPVSNDLHDWTLTHEHFPRSKAKGGHRTVDNALLAHRLCNRVDYSKSIGRSYQRDLARLEAARLRANEVVNRRTDE
jgi:hypothetical protein